MPPAADPDETAAPPIPSVVIVEETPLLPSVVRTALRSEYAFIPLPPNPTPAPPPPPPPAAMSDG
uniref:Uncharacterized protein n=1 Tax=uncultured marine virus TaxID=186617 RepID=A0A0F7L5F8_9VIRU|nr:hypothetical protein [uncultured marine virus]